MESNLQEILSEIGRLRNEVLDDSDDDDDRFLGADPYIPLY